MADSIVSISDLPDAESISETDKIYIISEQNGSFKKIEISLNDLSSFFYAKDTVEKLENKYNELIELSGNFLNFLKSNYPTANYVSSMFSKISYFNKIYSSLETTETVSSYLGEYVSTTDENYYISNTKTECEKLKLGWQKDSNESIMDELTPTDFVDD